MRWVPCTTLIWSFKELAPCQIKHFHVGLARIQSVPFKLGNASNGRVGEQGQRFLVQVKPVHIATEPRPPSSTVMENPSWMPPSHPKESKLKVKQ